MTRRTRRNRGGVQWPGGLGGLKGEKAGVALVCLNDTCLRARRVDDRVESARFELATSAFGGQRSTAELQVRRTEHQVVSAP